MFTEIIGKIALGHDGFEAAIPHFGSAEFQPRLNGAELDLIDALGITFRHHTHRTPLGFKAVMTIRQVAAFSSLIRGYVGECPFCKRRFPDS